jgi:hypothetical protein
VDPNRAFCATFEVWQALSYGLKYRNFLQKAASPIRETRWKRRLQEFKDNPHELRIVLQDEKYIKEDDAIAAMAKLVQAFGLYW